MTTKKALLNGTIMANFTLITVYPNPTAMKTKYTLAVLTMLMSVAAWAQEDDDMYFNAKDRAVLNKSVAQVMARRYQEADQQAIRTNPVNPSDSYSGRGVNPEYGAQTRNGTTLVQDNPNYFVSSYQPKNLNSSLYGSNSYYNTNPYSYGYNNPYLGYNGFGGMGYSGFGSPFGMYSPYSSMGLGYGWGGMGSGWYGGMGYGMGYGMGSMFSPFGSYAGMGYGLMSMYNPYGMGYGYGYSPYYGYPAYGYSGYATVIEPNAVHGRHSVRSSTVNNYVDNNRGSYTTTSNGTTRSSQMGRSAQNNYYDQGWRSNPNNYSRSDYNNSYNNNYNNGGTTRSSYNNSWGNSRSSFDSFGSGSRGGFSGGGGGGFSGGGGHSGGGGGGGGHSRGRN